MAAPSEGFWQRRGLLGLYELFESWWRHRISFLLSLTRVLYSERHWQAAQEAFQAILDKWRDDSASRACWERRQDYLFEQPPSAWDGVSSG